MATLIKMICSDCGYNSGTLRLGPTLMDGRFIIPAFDTVSQQIVSVDVEQIPNTAIPYNNEKLFKNKEGGPSFEFNNNDYQSDIDTVVIRLNKEHNFCPSCNGFSLQINEWGKMH